jgi:hypothetical protein
MWCIFRSLLRMMWQLPTRIPTFSTIIYWLMIMSTQFPACVHIALILWWCRPQYMTVLDFVMPLKYLGHCFFAIHAISIIDFPSCWQSFMLAHYFRQSISIVWSLPRIAFSSRAYNACLNWVIPLMVCMGCACLCMHHEEVLAYCHNVTVFSSVPELF